MSTITFDFRHYYRKGERRESDQIAYQWDLGHVAEIYVPVTATYEVHYCFADYPQTEDYAVESTTAAEGGGYKLTAHIPNKYFERSGELKVYVVGSDDNHILTTYEGYISIRMRIKPDDYTDDDPENEATRVLAEAREARDAAVEAAEQAEAAASQSAAQASIAEVYDATKTYAIGDYCLHDGQLYECTTEITTPEAWAAAHWTATTVGTELNDTKDEISGLKEDLNDNVADITNELYELTEVSTNFEHGLVNEDTGKNLALKYGIRTDYIKASAGDRIYVTVRTGATAKIFFYNGTNFIKTPEYTSLHGAERTYIAPQSATRCRISLYRDSDKQNAADVSDSISEVAMMISIYNANRKSDVDLLQIIPAYVEQWTENTHYKLGEQVQNEDTAYFCTVPHTSGGTFDSETNWHIISFDNELNSVSKLATQNGSFDIPGNICKIDKIIIHDLTQYAPNIGDVIFDPTFNVIAVRRRTGGFDTAFKIIPAYPGSMFSLHGKAYIWDDYELVSSECGRELIFEKPPIKYNNSYILSVDCKKKNTSSNTFISESIELNAGDVLTVHGYATAAMVVIAETDLEQSYYKTVITGTGEHCSDYTFTSDKHRYVCVSVTDNREYLYYIDRKKQAIIPVELTMAMPGTISNYGMLSPKTLAETFIVSTPVRVFKGDTINATVYAGPYAVLCDSPDRINTYQGNSYKVLYSSGSAGVTTFKYVCMKDGYVVFTVKNQELPAGFENSVEILRSADSDAEISARPKTITKYVEQYDFVPDLTKKRTNSILCYRGDNKKDESYIVNAVAYPNGELIACRAGGDVVKIDNNGTETVLMTIANAQDWRGVFMDSSLNVYVSPHSSTFNPGVAMTDRGLYRLPYGGSTFTKVISLCRSMTEIKKWAANTEYFVGDEIFRDNQSDMYICSVAHTSGSTFDSTNWTSVPNWMANTQYTVGNLCKYSSCYFRCKTDHTSADKFDITKWDAATEYMSNDDTIWTMCEDENGWLYAGVYSHSARANPAVYRSSNGGTTWFYQHNFIMNETLPESRYGLNRVRHVHCINFNEYDHCLYAAVGEVNTIVKSENHGATWQDLKVTCYYGQPTYVLGAPDGLVIGSDGHYSCGVSKLMTDGKTIKLCGRTAPGFVFNIRRSDVTGWLYAFTRIDNWVADTASCPPVEAITDPEALQAWKEDPNTDKSALTFWEDYNAWASKYYPEDAIRPQHAVMMVSRDDGDTWEVFYEVKVADNYASICGFITVGYFRDGELLVGLLRGVENTQDDKAFVQPVIISEGKKKRAEDGYDLSGEIFIKINSTNIVPYQVT